MARIEKPIFFGIMRVVWLVGGTGLLNRKDAKGAKVGREANPIEPTARARACGFDPGMKGAPRGGGDKL